jgi:hypothetical protein
MDNSCALVINVGRLEQTHDNGALGSFTVPPPPDGKRFGLLVIYPAKEIQDIGDKRTKTNDVGALSIGAAIVGIGLSYNPDDGTRQITHNVRNSREKYGLWLCDAQPDIPKGLAQAIEAEATYLNKHKPLVRYRILEEGVGAGAICAENIYEPGEREKREKMARTVIIERDEFHEVCRGLVKQHEIKTAETNLYAEYGRLVAQADGMWQRPNDSERGQRSISDLHRNACIALGQERPWCYTPQQLVDCPGCGGKIKDTIIKCGHCGAILDREFAEYAKMSRTERARLLYPEQALELETRPDQGPTKK